MSNPRIGGNPQSFQIGQKLERSTSVGNLKPTEGVQIGAKRSESLHRNLSTPQLKPITHNPIGDEGLHQTMSKGIDQTPPQELARRSGNLPTPAALRMTKIFLKPTETNEKDGLLEARGHLLKPTGTELRMNKIFLKPTETVEKDGLLEARGHLLKPTETELRMNKIFLKPTQTVEKTGLEHAQKQFREDSLHAKDNAKREPSQPGMDDQTFSQGVKALLTDSVKGFEKDYTKTLVEAERALPGELGKAFKDTLKSYLSATNARRGSVTDENAEKQVKAAARAWAKAQHLESDNGISLAGKTDGELRKLASDMLARQMDYSEKDMAGLSERKQHFINMMVEGLQQGIKDARKQADNAYDRGEAPGPAGKIKSALHDMSLELQKNIVALPPTDPMRKALLFSSPERFSTALRSELGAKSPEVMKSLLDASRSPVVSEDLVTRLMPGTAGNQRVRPSNLPGGSDYANLTLPDSITVNGVTYTAPRYLDSGGFADVFSYSNGNDKIVVKRNKDSDNPQKSLDLMAEECRGHLALQGENGNPNLIGFKALIKQGNESLAVIEFAGAGSLEGAKHNIWEMQKQGLINEDVRQLLGLHLLKGSLEGMMHIQNEQQGHHFDLKLPNVLLGDDGKPKIADFGFGGIGDTRMLSQLDGNQNPLYQSPQLIDAIDANRKTPGDSPISSQTDNWNAGIMAFTLLKDPNQESNIFKGKFMSQIEGNIQKFGTDGDNRIMPSAPQQGGGQGMGFNAIDKLINGLMHPDQNQRTNFEAALISSAFDDSRLYHKDIGKLAALISRTKPENWDDNFKLQVAQLVATINGNS